jgi:isocitrate lyase
MISPPLWKASVTLAKEYATDGMMAYAKLQ